MQQLYRCISWWLAHPNKQSFLILQKKQPGGNPFLQGILSILKSTMQVKVVRLRFDLKVVRGTRTYQWDDGKGWAWEVRMLFFPRIFQHSRLFFGAECMPNLLVAIVAEQGTHPLPAVVAAVAVAVVIHQIGWGSAASLSLLIGT
jgi:hypothetical protein